MTLATIQGFDVTAANYDARPTAGQIALYVTGTSAIVATAAMLDDNPSAITINQSGGSVVADIYDVESGAVTLAELPGLINQARLARLTGNGRRNPGVYCSEDNVTPVVNALTAAKLSGVPLWIADYNYTSAQAVSELQSSSGPYPVIGYQYHDAGNYDEDVWLESWVSEVSQIGTQTGWSWCAKCQGLFYGPHAADSHCPAGGAHTVGAWQYDLPYQAYTT